MSTTTQHTEEVSDQADGLAAKIGFVLGVDGEGDAHVHYPAADAVRVYDVGAEYEVGDRLPLEADREEDLGGRPLAEWMAYTEDERDEWQTTTHRAPEAFR